MRRAFPDAEVRGYENLAETMTCDPKDRHVLAAAVRSDAAVLVTFNIGDFPDTSTAELERRGLAHRAAEQRQPQTKKEPGTMGGGGASWKSTSPRWTWLSGATTRPRSLRASPGRLSAPDRPRPRMARQLRSLRDCSAAGTFWNRTWIRKLLPPNLRWRTRSARAAARAVRPVGPPGRPAGPCGRGRVPHRHRQRCARSPYAVHGPP